MASKPASGYRPLTPPLTWPERIADMLVMGVLIFWFGFLGLAPQKGRPEEFPERPSDKDRGETVPSLAAE